MMIYVERYSSNVYQFLVFCSANFLQIYLEIISYTTLNFLLEMRFRINLENYRLLQSLSNAMAASGSAYPYLLTSNNGHRIILTALITAHKYSMDIAYPLSILSRLVGVSLTELKILESEFLSFVKYELYVSQDLYEKYEEVMQNWPDMQEEEEAAEEEERSNTVHTTQPQEAQDSSNEVLHRKEESKEREEERNLSKRISDVKLTDEEYACNLPEYISEEKPNPANPHEKPVAESMEISPIRSSDVRNYTYLQYSEEDDGDADTEMTIVNEDDLGEDDFDEDIFIY